MDDRYILDIDKTLVELMINYIYSEIWSRTIFQDHLYHIDDHIDDHINDHIDHKPFPHIHYHNDRSL